VSIVPIESIKSLKKELERLNLFHEDANRIWATKTRHLLRRLVRWKRVVAAYKHRLEVATIYGNAIREIAEGVKAERDLLRARIDACSQQDSICDWVELPPRPRVQAASVPVGRMRDDALEQHEIGSR
jgi:hypothetical protein